MAVNKEEAREVVEKIEGVFDKVTAALPSKAKEFLREKILGGVIKEIKEYVTESRPPSLFLIGRSGHGKSSLINSLTNREVAEVGDVKPTTPETRCYNIVFEGLYSSWNVCDSRGLFETTTPEGASLENAKERLKKDLVEKKPDILLHVVSATEVRNLEQDFIVYKEIQHVLEKELGVLPPTIMVLTKVDHLGNPREWPPEEYPEKKKIIREVLDYMLCDVIKGKLGEDVNLVPLVAGEPERGYVVEGKVEKMAGYIGIIPVCALAGEWWNIEKLSEFIGSKLPASAVLQFFQAQRRKGLMKKFAGKMVNIFSRIAGGIGASPMPISDIMVLLPLQYSLIALIASLSCRKMSQETVEEFLAACRTTTLVGIGLRELFRQLIKIFIGPGAVLSAAIAAAGTWVIGQGAIWYFFDGITGKELLRRMKEIWKEKIKEMKERFKNKG
ncbi:hypothetical protein DRQ18_00030 [bacterium]|nr:MAG: hypothetical protein DRQ18_00030 [bacterium]